MVELKLYKLVAILEIHFVLLYIIFVLLKKSTERVALIFSGGSFAMASLGLLYRWYKTASFEMIGAKTGLLEALIYHPPFATAAESIMVLTTLTTLLTFLAATKQKHSLILIPAVLIALLCLGLPHIKGVEIKALHPQLYSPLFFIHTLLLFTSYGFFIMGFSSSVLLLFSRSSEHSTLKYNRTGFALFTLGLAFGFLWGWIAWGAAFSTDPKVLLSGATWFVYGASLHKKRGQSDRKIAILTIISFLLLVLTSVGVGFKLFGDSTHAFL